jgi:hypothetical protein
MRKIPEEQLAKIRSLAKQLQDAVDEADCRLLAQNDCYWDTTIRLVPEEVEMWHKARELTPEEDESGKDQCDLEIDLDTVPAIDDLSVTILSTETNSLYEEGDGAGNYF